MNGASRWSRIPVIVAQVWRPMGAIEIQAGAAVARPFFVDKQHLEQMISRRIASAL